MTTCLAQLPSAYAEFTGCKREVISFAAAMVAMMMPFAAGAQLVTGFAGGSGSTVGPDRALYVTEGAARRVSRVDPQTGEVTTFPSGLPSFIIGVGGAIDVAFIGGTAYVLVTLVGPDTAIVGAPAGSDIVGIYRIDGPDSFTVIAAVGRYSMNHPPNTAFFFPTGVQYSPETFRDGFLVADGHHNRILRVTLDGEISELIAFDNIVPTGLEVWGDSIFMAEAGTVPRLPQDGEVVSFGPGSSTVTEGASGARLLVDVEFGRGRKLYALSQGE